MFKNQIQEKIINMLIEIFYYKFRLFIAWTNIIIMIEVEDMIRRPQLVSALRPIIQTIENKIHIDLDDLLLDEYHKIRMNVSDSEENYKILDYSVDKEITSKDFNAETMNIDTRICSNCKCEKKIAKSAYSPSFVIHFCEMCIKVFDYPFGDIIGDD